MTLDDKVATLRDTLLGGYETNEETLLFYLDTAKRIILNHRYPYGGGATEVPTQYEHIQLQIATYLLNKRGAEGQVTHSENGVSRTYASSDIPSEMLREIIPYAGLPL